MKMRPPTTLPLALALALGSTLAATETLPTPYTAEQIRDAHPADLRVVTRTTTPDGVTYSRLQVDAATADSMTFTDQTVDADGEPVGEPVTGTASWTDLRDHASFPATRATRKRHSATTALGTFDGWLYRLEGADGERTELFFADALPGAPVLFTRTLDGRELYRAEQIERGID